MYAYGLCIRIMYTIIVCPCWPASTTNQSGLVTLNFDLLILKVVSESRVTWATCVPILVCSQLMPDVRDRQTSDKSIA